MICLNLVDRSRGSCLSAVSAASTSLTVFTLIFFLHLYFLKNLLFSKYHMIWSYNLAANFLLSEILLHFQYYDLLIFLLIQLYHTMTWIFFPTSFNFNVLTMFASRLPYIFYWEFRRGIFCFISSIIIIFLFFTLDLYWFGAPLLACRFHSIAYLQQIWWFEVNGVVEFPLPAGNYSLFFRLQLGRSTKRLGRRVCNSEDVHGWDIKPVQFQLSTSDGQRAATQCYLDEPGNWIHYHAGDFVVENPSAPTKVRFSMTQIDCTHIKGGLCVDSVLIYPSEFKERLKRFLL